LFVLPQILLIGSKAKSAVMNQAIISLLIVD